MQLQIKLLHKKAKFEQQYIHHLLLRRYNSTATAVPPWNGDGFGVRLEVLKLRAEDSTKRRSCMEGNVGDRGKESYECPLLGKSAELLGMRGGTLVSEVINYSATEQF